MLLLRFYSSAIFPLFVLLSSVGKLEEGEILTPSHYLFVFLETSHATGHAGAHARCFVPSEKILRNCRRRSCLVVWRSPENPFNSFGPHQSPHAILLSPFSKATVGDRERCYCSRFTHKVEYNDGAKDWVVR